MLKCPNCGESPLAHAMRDLHYTYKGKSTVIPEVEVEYCGGCKEVMFARGEAEHYGELIQAFRRQVDAAVEPAYVREVRRKLRLTREGADAVFGVQSGDFARFETGKKEAPLPLAKLLKLVDRHPELLGEIR